MAEIKFACPLCGQHIQCDPGYAGTQINCPICQRVIVVPQAPRGSAPATRPQIAAKSRTLQNILIIATGLVILAGLVFVGWLGYSKIRMDSKREGLPPGLVALWSGEGNTQDSVGGHHGQLLKQAGFAAGKVGKAFVFHTAGDGVTAPALDLPDGTSDRTIDCWVYIKKYIPNGETAMAGYGNFGADGQVYYIGLDVNHHLFFSQWGEAIVGPIPRLDHWYNVAVTSVGTNTIKLYLNGVNVATGSLNFDTPPGSQFRIGEVEAPYAERQLIGLIDEVAVYNRALSDSEIRAVYAKQK
jgi:hypothetical protein